MKRSPLIVRWSLWILNGWLLGTLLSLTIGSAAVCAAHVRSPAAVNVPGKITLQDGKLTARIVAVPLRQVMEEVGRLSRAQVRWLSQEGEEPVSVEFPALPLPEALRRILGERNFMLFYTSAGEETKLTQIWIASRGIGGEQPVLTPQPVPEGKTTLIAEEEPYEDLTQLLDALIRTAMNDEDLSLRLRAIELLATHAGEDPRVKEILSHLAYSDSDPQVQEAASAALERME